MKTKRYHTMQEVQKDLKILKLQRDIALAELEGTTLDLEERIRSLKAFVYIGNLLKKCSTLFLLRKFFK